jgi:hypothetical protein
MRNARGLVRALLGCWVGLLTSGPASAQLLIVEPSNDASTVQYAELAYAFGASGPVTWLSLRADGGPVALVAALEADARGDEGLDAWFGALEQVGSPRVLPPNAETMSCGLPLTPLPVDWPRSPGRAPSTVELRSAADVSALLDAQGFVAPEELPEASRYLVWSWPASSAAFTTRTLRIRGQSEPLELMPHAVFPVLLSALTRGAMTYRGELTSSELPVTVTIGKPISHDYRERALDWLGSHGDALLELRARGPLFDWTIYDEVTVPPLVRAYADAAALELPALDVVACAERLGAWREPPVTASDSPGCDEASDAELALAAVDSDVATLERLIASSRAVVSWRAFAPGGQPRAPLLRAHQLDTSRCVTAPAPVSAGASQPPGVSGPSTPAVIRDEVEPEREVVVVEHQPVEVDCSGSPDSTHYRDDEIDCSSQPGSGAESDDTDCSSDSSSSQSDDADCSSDSSSSQSDDAGCSSDSSSTSDRDSCSGDSTGDETPSEGKDELAMKPRRLKTSLWSVVLAALVLPIRRRKRGLRAAG